MFFSQHKKDEKREARKSSNTTIRPVGGSVALAIKPHPR